ncbi:10597_t:CDS:2, partial [Ambispora leptoticha]
MQFFPSAKPRNTLRVSVGGWIGAVARKPKKHVQTCFVEKPKKHVQTCFVGGKAEKT